MTKQTNRIESTANETGERTMRLQGDKQTRVVFLDNLKAMCDRVSGMTHRYWVERVTRARVYVAYSNPDEYGYEQPYMAVFPLYPANYGDENRDNPHVVLDMIDTVHEPNDYFGEGWQSFEALLDCPKLWRNPDTGEWELQDKPFCDYEDCDQTVANPGDLCEGCEEFNRKEDEYQRQRREDNNR